MMKGISKKFLIGTTIAAGCLLPVTASASEADGFNTFESMEYYTKHANELTQDDWYEDFASKLPNLTEAQKTMLKGLHYYLRLNPKADLGSIKTHEDPSNPDNVNRVIRLMPEADYAKMFPASENGPCSYLNFLKAVAVLPGLCSDYKDFHTLTGLEPTDDMKDPDLIAKKILAAIMANAIQETSNSGQGDTPPLSQKVTGTFNTIKEQESPDYNTRNMGPFAADKIWASVAEGNIYSGRGVHQVTYAVNYANISLILYGDLRLVKYPDLIVSDSFLPWLTTLIYFILPQSQYPTIAEVFDGQWERHLNCVVDQPEEFKDNYKKEFPVCVLLINGGIECGSIGRDQTPAIKNNTKIRGDAYYHFAKNKFIDVKGIKKELFAKNSPEDTKALTPEEMLQACHSISQAKSDKQTVKGIYDGLNWYRPFFLNMDVHPISYCIGDMPFVVFAGKNVAKLYNK